jgi:DUF1680 family protein
LAGKIIRGMLRASKGFHEDGRWILSHFHTATASLLAFLEYATITGDSELLEFVNRCYEYGKAAGDPLVGFFAEHARGSDEYRAGWGGYWPNEELVPHSYKSPDPRDITCESCEVADMIGLALKLTQAGAGDYWEDADRWVRNQYVESQMTHDKLRALLRNLYADERIQEFPVQPWESDEVERCVGGWAASTLPNDWGLLHGHACCTGNSARTLYWIWDSILTKEDDKVVVNLLLNRASPWLDVDSHLPYEGKVALKVKEAKAAGVRIPDWTDRERVTCTVNSEEQAFSWSGSYVEIGDLKPGDAVTIDFPMREKTMFSAIADKPYRVTLKGNTVVAIDPDGELCPLYQRGHYSQERAPMKSVTRFVSRERIRW